MPVDEANTRPGPTDLADLLSLDSLGENSFRAALNDENIDGEIFGGQYLGQSVWAAMATAPDFVPHTLFGFFLRAARADRPLHFVVEQTRQGRRFAHRRVTIWQAGQEVFRSEVSLTRPDDDQPAHQRPMPAAASPEGLRPLRTIALENAELLGPVATARLTKKSLFSTFPIAPAIGIDRPGTTPAGQFWVKAKLDKGADRRLHYAALAYLSDVMANMPSRAMHTANAYDGTISAVSMNHGVWFHHTPQAADWLLFDLESCFAGGGVGTNRGLIYGADGRLFGSVMQDAMIRWAGEAGKP